MAKRLVEKCNGPKRKPLEREYPNICSILSPLQSIEFCANNNWDIRRLEQTTISQKAGLLQLQLELLSMSH